MGDVQKAGMPSVGAAAGTFGSDGNLQPLALAEFLHHDVRQRLTALFASDRYAAYGLENPAERRKEPRGLHHETGMTSHGSIGELAQYEIPVAGVRSHADKKLRFC